MKTPFPGMDPYLERPDLWPDVHYRLIAALGDILGPMIRPRYYITVEERIYLEGPASLDFLGKPDMNILKDDGGRRYNEGKAASSRALTVEVPVPDEVKERYLTVKSADDHELVTVLELLSPSNKREGQGRKVYEKKRMHILGDVVNLVEVDLIRADRPMTVFGAERPSDYRILVSRETTRPRAELYAFGVRDPIPTFALPLRPKDKEPEVDIGSTLHALYDRASYDMRIDYRAEPVPPLAEADRAWARDLTASAARR